MWSYAGQKDCACMTHPDDLDLPTEVAKARQDPSAPYADMYQ